MSCIPNTFVFLSFVGSFVQRCEQYAEYDAFICTPDPSNPWITDDVTLWEQDKSLYVSYYQQIYSRLENQIILSLFCVNQEADAMVILIRTNEVHLSCM